jgi:hypothetical protein
MNGTGTTESVGAAFAEAEVADFAGAFVLSVSFVIEFSCQLKALLDELFHCCYNFLDRGFAAEPVTVVILRQDP